MSEELQEIIRIRDAITVTLTEDEDDLNQFFLLTMGAIIMFMQAGFAFLEAGSVRSKNVTNILIKNFLDFFAGALVYWAVGFAFAYGDELESSNSFIGNHGFFATHQYTSKFYTYWFFNFVFAVTSATIISGAVAERTQFGAYFIYTLAMIGFIFPCVSHWVWSPIGWLKNAEITAGPIMAGVSFMDFAGSGVVHVTGGTAALLGAYFIGPRIGRFDKAGNVQFMPGHSVPIAALGGFILFLGFLCFNGGSEMAIVTEGITVSDGDSHGLRVARAFMNSVLGAAGGAVSSIGIGYVLPLLKKEPAYWSLLICMNGGLAGMVASCAACENMHNASALCVGFCAGCTYFWASACALRFKIDDPIEAFGVHFGGGFTGIILAPILSYDGVVYWQNCSQQEEAWLANNPLDDTFYCDYLPFKRFAWNLLGLICIIIWSGTLTSIVFYFLKSFELLRVDRNTEKRGLDIRKHNEPAYPTAAYGHGWLSDDPRASKFAKAP